MIAGYDFLILRGRARRFWTRTRIAGAALLLAGGLLIGIGGAYYGYASNARSNLDSYQVAAVEVAPQYAFPEIEKIEQAEVTPASALFIPEVSLYSGDAGVDFSVTGPSLPEGFELIDFSGDNPLMLVAPATQLSIPSLEIESSVVELSIENLDGTAGLIRRPVAQWGISRRPLTPGRTATGGTSATWKPR